MTGYKATHLEDKPRYLAIVEYGRGAGSAREAGDVGACLVGCEVVFTSNDFELHPALRD